MTEGCQKRYGFRAYEATQQLEVERCAVAARLLQQHAIERFLHRVSKSKHAKSVIMKGALLLKTIDIPSARPTMHIDMLRKGNADQASLVTRVKDCAGHEVEVDGLAASSAKRLWILLEI